MTFKVIYLTGGRNAEIIDADEYIEEGRMLVFRRKSAGGAEEHVMSVRADAVDHVEIDGQEPCGREIVLTGHDLLRLERGEEVTAGEFTLRVDHSSAQDYPLTNPGLAKEPLVGAAPPRR